MKELKEFFKEYWHLMITLSFTVFTIYMLGFNMHEKNEEIEKLNKRIDIYESNNFIFETHNSVDIKNSKGEKVLAADMIENKQNGCFYVFLYNEDLIEDYGEYIIPVNKEKECIINFNRGDYK